MLLRFSVRNFHSFREVQTLDLCAVASCKERLEENTALTFGGRTRALKSAAIYGANASGKTNLFVAARLFRALICQSFPLDAFIPVAPFLFDADSRTKPTEMEAVFTIGDIRYRYGFSATREAFLKEWLYATSADTNRTRTLFLRDGSSETPVIDVGASFPKDANVLVERTRPSALFLSVCAQFAIKEVESIVSYLINNLLWISWDKDLHDGARYTMDCLANGREVEPIETFIRQTDPAIQRIELQDLGTSDATDISPSKRKRLCFLPPYGTEVLPIEQFCSLGTLKSIQLAGPLFHALKTGATLFVDELDARLHPILSKAIIELFNSAQTNPNCAQIIFTTHDTNLLSASVMSASGEKERLLRRDQIYFIERDAAFASHLYSLIEFKRQGNGVRKDASYEKDYLAGLYGAIPYLGAFNLRKKAP